MLFNHRTAKNTTSCAILFIGNSFVSSSRDGTVCIWNMESLQMVKELEKHTEEINCLNTTVGYN